MTEPKGLRNYLKSGGASIVRDGSVPMGVVDCCKIQGEPHMARSGSAKLVNRTTITVNADTKQRLESFMCDGEILDTTLLRILDEYLIYCNVGCKNDAIKYGFDMEPLELICKTRNGEKVVVSVEKRRPITINSNNLTASKKSTTILQANGQSRYGVMKKVLA